MFTIFFKYQPFCQIFDINLNSIKFIFLFIIRCTCRPTCKMFIRRQPLFIILVLLFVKCVILVLTGKKNNKQTSLLFQHCTKRNYTYSLTTKEFVRIDIRKMWFKINNSVKYSFNMYIDYRILLKGYIRMGQLM